MDKTEVIKNNDEIKEEHVSNEVTEDKESEKAKSKARKLSFGKIKLDRKKIILILVSIVAVFLIVIVGFVGFDKKIKSESFFGDNKKKVKKIEKTITYEEYDKDATEYFYDRIFLKMSKDYLPMITLEDERIFEKKRTKQKVVFYIRENTTTKKEAREQLKKYVKEQNKNAKYIGTSKFNGYEFDIFQGKDENGKNIKYIITCNLETKFLMTYTYSKEGQDTDIDLILESVRI